MDKTPEYVERELDDGSENRESCRLTSLRELISDEMENRDDSWDNVISTVVELSCPYEDKIVTSEFTDEILDREFYHGHGGGNCHYFSMWTKTRVYYPAEYDGLIWVASRSRNPDGKAVRSR